MGVLELIDKTGVDLTGKRVVIVGLSVLVGKPLVHLLLERGATLVLCHEFTRDLAAEVAGAEVLVSAVGKAGLIRGEWIRPGAVVIDVGITHPEWSPGRRRVRSGPTARQLHHSRSRRRGSYDRSHLLRNTLFAAQRICMQVH